MIRGNHGLAVGADAYNNPRVGGLLPGSPRIMAVCRSVPGLDTEPELLASQGAACPKRISPMRMRMRMMMMESVFQREDVLHKLGTRRSVGYCTILNL